MNDDLSARAANKDKKFHIVEGASHMHLYDGEREVAEAPKVLGDFFARIPKLEPVPAEGPYSPEIGWRQ